jgi:hypothetical protein
MLKAKQSSHSSNPILDLLKQYSNKKLKRDAATKDRESSQTRRLLVHFIKNLVASSGVDKGGVQGVRTPPRADPYFFTTE